MPFVRQIVLYVFYSWCIAVVLIAALYIAAIGSMIFTGGFHGSSEFIGRSGYAAKPSMSDWPSEVSASKVRSVSQKFAHEMDSYSLWRKIELDSTSAITWADAVHAQREKRSLDLLDSHHRGLEGVRRSMTGPPPLHWTTGETPEWWNPPAIEFRATEAMLWYSGSDSGVGQAAYTGFDEGNQTLWVYEYSCQHDQLWERNSIPDGDVFSR